MKKRRNNHNGSVLQDYKKVGHKLIPPMLQLDNIQETSFRDDTLPCLIWISALLLRVPERLAVDTILEFISGCDKSLDGKSPRLSFLNNYNELTNEQKKIIRGNIEPNKLELLQDALIHQFHLLPDYPLAFLFNDYAYSIDKDEAIELLSEDVEALLDRYTPHATKVQTTAYVALMMTKKIMFSSSINIPDFNSVFIDHKSEEARKTASFVRAGLNAGIDFLGSKKEKTSNQWATLFWKNAFIIKECS